MVRYRMMQLDLKSKAMADSLPEGYLPLVFSSICMQKARSFLDNNLGQFTRNYTQTVKRAADNKRRYAPGEGSIPPVLLSGVSKGVPPLAHDFACKV